MSYVDYSANWTLDQFFTYLQANQLGSNDKHIVDNFSAEHNWNAATVDGTHKANSILGSYINKNPVSTGSQIISAFTSWIPTSGVYQIVNAISVMDQDAAHFKMYISGTWRYAETNAPYGLFFCDGSNVAFENEGLVPDTAIIYYQKF